MSEVVRLTQRNFRREVLESHLPVLVDYWVAWCGPCRIVGPIVEELARERAGSLKVGKVDVDSEPELAARAGVRGIPFVVLYRDGEPVAQALGALPKDRMVRILGLDAKASPGGVTLAPVAAPALADVDVQTVEGDRVRIGELVDRPTILVIPRYYGCLPCRDYLRQVSERLDEVQDAGASALGVSVGAAHQARWLIEQRGIGFPLLVDPNRKVYDALNLPRKWWVSLNPRGWWNYARAIARGSRQGRIIEPNQLPGLALLDARATAVWVHRGRALGDYPKLDRVLAELSRRTGS